MEGAVEAVEHFLLWWTRETLAIFWVKKNRRSIRYANTLTGEAVILKVEEIGSSPEGVWSDTTCKELAKLDMSNPYWRNGQKIDV